MWSSSGSVKVDWSCWRWLWSLKIWVLAGIRGLGVGGDLGSRSTLFFIEMQIDGVKGSRLPNGVVMMENATIGSDGILGFG